MKSTIIKALSILLITLIIGCSSEKEATKTIPQVTTTTATNITYTNASIGGNVSADGGATVTSKGVVWSTISAPTISLTSKTSDGTGTGNFTSAIANLSPSTNYFVRAYATNSLGTAYGNEVVIKTLDVQILVKVDTGKAYFISSNTAYCGVNQIYNYTAFPISARGIVWSTSPSPTISLPTKTSEELFNPGFPSFLNGLTPLTTYYVRAYAINSLGTFYGNEISFKTEATYSYTQGQTVIDIDGNSYPTIVTNCKNQVWSTKNLNVTRYRNGDVIPYVQDTQQWNDLKTGAWCYPEGRAANADKYGRLYNWYAVNDPRGLAPQGYNIPTGNDWITYIDFLGGNGLAGGKMKESGITNWNVPNTNANNSSGFNGIPGSIRVSDGYTKIGASAEWWIGMGNLPSINPSNYPSSAGSFSLAADNGFIEQHSSNPSRGYSVRFIKN